VATYRVHYQFPEGHAWAGIVAALILEALTGAEASTKAQTLGVPASWITMTVLVVN